MTTKTNIRFCEFTGDNEYDWDEVGYKKLCPHAGFRYCKKYNKPITISEEGWRECCDECEKPIQIK